MNVAGLAFSGHEPEIAGLIMSPADGNPFNDSAFSFHARIGRNLADAWGSCIRFQPPGDFPQDQRQTDTEPVTLG